MTLMIKTVIERSWPMKTHIQYKKSIDDIFSSIVQMHLQGINGLEILYEIKGIQNTACLESRQSVRNIEQFEMKTRSVQKMGILKNATGRIVNILAEWMFLSADLEDWLKKKARNIAKVYNTPGLDRMYQRNETTMGVAEFEILEDEDNSD